MRTLAIFLLAALLAATPALAASDSDAQAALDKARSDIATLAESKISTFAANDLLKEAELQFSNGNYNRSAYVSAEISSLVASAIHANALMEQAEPLIAGLESAGADTKDIRTAFSDASSAFLREDFKAAEQRAQDAMNRIGDAQLQAGLQNTLFEAEGKAAAAFVQKYWIVILGVCAAAAYGGLRFWKSYEKTAHKGNAARLKAKRETIIKLMKEAQQKHFIDGSMSKKEYLITMRNYREQLADIKRQLKLLRGKR